MLLLVLSAVGLYAGFLVVYAVVSAIFTFRRSKAKGAVLGAIPYPSKSHPYLGTLKDRLKPQNTHRFFDWMVDQYNECCPVREDGTRQGSLAYLPAPVFQTQHSVVTMDPAIVKHILSDNFNNYTKQTDTDNSVVSYMFQRWLGEGIFSVSHGPHAPDNGKAWVVQRKIAANIFTRNNFRTLMRNVFLDKAKVMNSVLEAHISDTENGELTDRKVDMQKMFFAFTMDSITNIFFGRNTETIREEVDPYAQAYDSIQKHLIRFAIQNIKFSLFAGLLPRPLGGQGGLLMKLCRRLSAEGRAYDKCLQVLNETSRNIVNQRRKEPDLDSKSDLLALFMNAMDKETGIKYSDPRYGVFLRDCVLSFIIAGRDTTACTLTWLFFLLSTNPQVQEKLIEEIDTVIGDKDPEYDDLTPNKLPYLNGVIYETLRLFPPVPQDNKIAQDEDTLPDGSKIPPNTRVIFFPYGMGRDPCRYPNPEKFDPTRWIPFKNPSPYEFPVFQAGPRICLGMNMALFESKLVVIKLLQSFTFDILPGEAEKITYAQAITMSLCNSRNQDSSNLWLIPRRREAKA